VELFQQFAAVCFVLALAGLAAWWLKRGVPDTILIAGRRRGNARRLELIQRLPLTTQHHVCLVRLDGKELLVAVYPNGITVSPVGPTSAYAPTGAPDRKESLT
jgi:flagellar biogenesis protein FliO